MKGEKGSLTVEAAITLPIFLFVILSIVFLIKTVYVHEIMQHAIYETANEISTYSYLLASSGIKDLDDSIKGAVEERSAKFNESLDNMVEAYASIGHMKNSISGAIEDTKEGIKDGDLDIDTSISNVEENYEEFKRKINSALESGTEMLEGTDGVYSMLFSMGGLIYDDAKSYVLQNISKLLVAKYISPNNPSEINAKLKILNIDGTLKDLDFTQSMFFENGNDIDIIVRYKLNLVLPINIFPDLYIVQRATVRGWLDGYGTISLSETGETKVEEPDIWSWPNNPRGEYIKEEFGKNLPKNFKTLDIFENGEATSIISRDTRSKSYEELTTLESSIRSSLNDLVNYNGYKLQGVEIKPEDIKSKKLLLVIPTGEYSEERQNLIGNLNKEYSKKGVKIEVREFK